MIRKASFPLLLAILVAGCAINDQRAGLRPQNTPAPDKARAAEYRALATVVSGGKAVDGRLAYVNPKARIKLLPTPGFETAYEKGVEVLASRESGAYTTFIDLVPITRYFRILRRADCDDWGTNLPIIADNYNRHPEFYLQSDGYQGDKPHYACLSAFDEYYLQHDPRLIGADGVLFDVKNARIDSTAIHWSLFSQKVKIHMPGWAIQFGEPTSDEIGQLLQAMPSSEQSIERLQLRTLVYWIQKHRSTEYVKELLSLLPTNRPEVSGRAWQKEDELVLQTLAIVAANTTSSEEWWRVLEVGAADFISPRVPVAGDARAAPSVAANVLVCRGEGRDDLARRFAAIVAGPYPYQNKQAAAVALRTLGHGHLLREYMINPSQNLANAISGDSTFKCPYSSRYDAI